MIGEGKIEVVEEGGKQRVEKQRRKEDEVSSTLPFLP